ncbi:5-methyltetrahydrofolate--homocysteine methyltransferase [Oceanispirochaeta crateris]|uniref:methionine synthase n=1 Tax=Oceanispirochaeta crateris TaxID=2518645 RepID=A0A5C1QQ10_9SPIO|nr:dihydropteroate synthase [Oceanispirochaeta crateris]QEN09681.1 5-methyltetrahydrofolate--homocysteine methyltransferase [Oceanispirochaeta crateris]
MKPSIASLYEAVDLIQPIKPLIIGERCNANGSRRFKEALLNDDYDTCLTIAREQEAVGAHVLDLCTAYAGRDEMKDFEILIPSFASSLKVPLMIDSTTPSVIEKALKLYPGRCIVNSVNLEDGGVNIYKVLKQVKKYGAAVVALTIDEKGMAMTTADKVAVAKRIYAIAVDEMGLRPQDILFDPLTFTIGAGDETLKDAAIQTLEAIRGIKEELPGCLTMLGLSNISFGLSAVSRKILNAVFLHEALEYGLDSCIIDAAKVISLASIPEEDREICLDLLYDRVKNPEKSPLLTFIDHFSTATADSDNEEDTKWKPIETQLYDKVVTGNKDDLEDVLDMLLQRRSPLGIINDILVPGMRHVGELFGKGEILLPFVLQSAEVMKTSVRYLEPLMEKSDEESRLKILLATVQGDVHDIGKNLVDIILSNNGYKVYNIGIKVPAETVIQKAREYDVDIIGLSGLLVKSAMVMAESLPQYEEAGFKVPIFLGGAALTRKFVAESCVPGYGSPVVYNQDAFDALKKVRDFEAGTLEATTWTAPKDVKEVKPGLKDATISRVNPVPEPPFLGDKIVKDIDLEAVLNLVNKQALFRGRWGYRRGKMSAAEYEDLIKTKVEPLYEEFRHQFLHEGLIDPKAAYGYFSCESRDDHLVMFHNDREFDYGFPRQAEAPFLCLSDYYKSAEEGGDVAGLFVVTIGDEVSKRTAELYEADAYHDYLMLHAFSVEVTDALAEYWHKRMRQELGITSTEPESIHGYVTQQYQGSRYGFGYPSCPDISAHGLLFDMLDPSRIGITLTENFEMVPEQSTSALVAHHPQAKYFAV